MGLYRSTRLLMCLSLETLLSIIRTAYLVLVELIDLVKSVIIFLSQMTLVRGLTFLLGIPDRDSRSPALFDLFLSSSAIVLQWLSLHCEILVMCLSQFPLTFRQTKNGIPRFMA